MKNKEFKTDFIPVPFMAVKDERLTPASRLILGVIYYITEKRGEKFFMSNKYIADILNMSAGSIHNSLALLESSGYVLRIYNDENTKRLEIKCMVRIQKGALDNAGGALDNAGGASTSAHNKIPNKIKEEEYMTFFDKIRVNYRKYMKGTTRGLSTEWKYFKKLNKDYSMDLLEEIYRGTSNYSKKLIKDYKSWEGNQKGKDPYTFVPHFKTYIYNRKWEEHLDI